MTNELSESLVDDCRAILTEAVFNSRWVLIEGMHALGMRILEEKSLDRGDVYGKKILSGLSKSLKIGERTLYRAVEFAEKYPSLDLLPMGKNISWNKIITQLLPANVTQIEERICPTCGRKY